MFAVQLSVVKLQLGFYAPLRHIKQIIIIINSLPLSHQAKATSIGRILFESMYTHKQAHANFVIDIIIMTYHVVGHNAIFTTLYYQLY